MTHYNVVIKTKGANAAYHVGSIAAAYITDAISGAVKQFADATGLVPAKDFNVAILTEAEANAFDAGTFNPFSS